MNAPRHRWPSLRADHIWCQILAAGGGAARPALFVDRDGVVVDEVDYLHRRQDVALIDGADRTLALANALGMPVVMVTNQAGIGRGYYGWDEFADVNGFILAALAARGARVDAVLACPFHAQADGALRHADHPMRKPNPGMFLLAGACLPIDFARSLVVGDQASDLQAGRAAGLTRGFHVLTGHGRQRRAAALALAAPGFAVGAIDSIADPALARALHACAPLLEDEVKP